MRRNSLIFQRRAQDLISQAAALHTKAATPEAFSGPALYFHKKALSMAYPLKSELLHESCDAVYAMLAAWGMHRMGRGGPKVGDYENFVDSMRPLVPILLGLQNKSIIDLELADREALRKAFLGINVMRTRTILVGHSKVLAHYLPHLVGPVDRQYTLQFLKGSTYCPDNQERQAQLFLEILHDFYHVVATDTCYQGQASGWVERNTGWDTSILKTVDNLVIRAKGRSLEG